MVKAGEVVAVFADRVAPFLVALQSFLACLQLLDALGVEVNVVVHRVWELRRFEVGVDLSLPLVLLLVFWGVTMIIGRKPWSLVLPLAAVVVLPFMGFRATVSLASLIAVSVSLWLGLDLRGYLTCVFLVVGGFEVLALLHWVLFVPLGLSSPLGSVALLELELFYLALLLGPYLGLTLVFVSVLNPVVYLLGGEGLRLEGVERRGVVGISSWVVFSLMLVVYLSVVAAVYPYFPGVNPRGVDIGVDIRYYAEWLEMVEGDLSQAFNISGGSRPLIFLTLYGFEKLTGLDALGAVRFLPVILNPLLALSVFFLALEVFGDGRTAVWAVFFTVCGSSVSVGMFSYFLTNMLGLSLAFTSLGLLFRSLRSGSRSCLVFSSLLGGLLVFTHPWTFNQYSAGAIVTTMVLWYYARRGEGGYEGYLIMAFYVGSLGLSEAVKVLVFRGVGGVSATATVATGLTSFSRFWYDLARSFFILYDGLMSDPVIIALAIVGVLFLGLGNISDLYLWVFMAVTSMVFLVGGEVVKSRLFYNIPIGLLASRGFVSLMGNCDSEDLRRSSSYFLVIFMVVYLFRALANLV